MPITSVSEISLKSVLSVFEKIKPQISGISQMPIMSVSEISLKSVLSVFENNHRYLGSHRCKSRA